MRDLHIEQGIARILELMENVHNSTEMGSSIPPVVSGYGILLPTDPIGPLPYLTQCWITATRDFKQHNQIQLEFAIHWNFHLARENNELPTEFFRRSGHLTSKDLIHLNSVRLYLQVATTTDITSTADGKYLKKAYFLAEITTQRTSKLQWPRQPCVTHSQ